MLMAAFAIAEMISPSFIMGFFALGSLVTAIVSWIFPLPMVYYTSIFILSSVLSLMVARRFVKETFRGGTIKGEDLPHKSRIGQIGIVADDIHPNMPGTIKLAGTFWSAKADVVIISGRAVEIVNHSGPAQFVVKSLQNNVNEMGEP